MNKRASSPGLAACERNLADLVRHVGVLGDVELHDDLEAVWTRSSRAGEVNHLAMPRFRRNSVETRIEEIVEAWCSGAERGVCWLSPLARPRDLYARLCASPHKDLGELLGMAFELRAPTCAEVEIKVVEDFSIFASIEHPYFGRPRNGAVDPRLEVRKELSEVRPRRLWHLVKELDGRPVASVSVFIGSGAVAGLYDVGVLQGMRSRGVGAATVSSALAFARDLGCRAAVLQARKEAASFFEHAGFSAVGEYRVLSVGKEG